MKQESRLSHPLRSKVPFLVPLPLPQLLSLGTSTFIPYRRAGSAPERALEENGTDGSRGGKATAGRGRGVCSKISHFLCMWQRSLSTDPLRPLHLPSPFRSVSSPASPLLPSLSQSQGPACPQRGDLGLRGPTSVYPAPRFPHHLVHNQVRSSSEPRERRQPPRSPLSPWEPKKFNFTRFPSTSSPAEGPWLWEAAASVHQSRAVA